MSCIISIPKSPCRENYPSPPAVLLTGALVYLSHHPFPMLGCSTSPTSIQPWNRLSINQMYIWTALLFRVCMRFYTFTPCLQESLELLNPSGHKICNSELLCIMKWDRLVEMAANLCHVRDVIVKLLLKLLTYEMVSHSSEMNQEFTLRATSLINHAMYNKAERGRSIKSNFPSCSAIIFWSAEMYWPNLHISMNESQGIS